MSKSYFLSINAGKRQAAAAYPGGKVKTYKLTHSSRSRFFKLWHGWNGDRAQRGLVWAIYRGPKRLLSTRYLPQYFAQVSEVQTDSIDKGGI